MIKAALVTLAFVMALFGAHALQTSFEDMAVAVQRGAPVQTGSQ